MLENQKSKVAGDATMIKIRPKSTGDNFFSYEILKEFDKKGIISLNL